MNDQIKQIAERLRGLRDVLELTSEDIARDCDISAEEYRLAETGQYDISVSMLQKIARTYNIALDTLMYGIRASRSIFPSGVSLTGRLLRSTAVMPVAASKALSLRDTID